MTIWKKNSKSFILGSLVIWNASKAVIRICSVLASRETVITRNILLLTELFPSYTLITSAKQITKKYILVYVLQYSIIKNNTTSTIYYQKSGLNENIKSTKSTSIKEISSIYLNLGYRKLNLSSNTRCNVAWF